MMVTCRHLSSLVCHTRYWHLCLSSATHPSLPAYVSLHCFYFRSYWRSQTRVLLRSLVWSEVVAHHRARLRGSGRSGCRWLPCISKTTRQLSETLLLIPAREITAASWHSATTLSRFMFSLSSYFHLLSAYFLTLCVNENKLIIAS